MFSIILEGTLWAFIQALLYILLNSTMDTGALQTFIHTHFPAIILCLLALWHQEAQEIQNTDTSILAWFQGFRLSHSEKVIHSLDQADSYSKKADNHTIGMHLF